ncbi:hypothetical protein WICPIJ_007789 [Wickerhamomyces pijperi]|uniref:Uncharacterized protein n=1 Tax=Wickerhamomyces pijperi TaxID=599730 RepID=A0A9P8PZK9_WICPI|nr:hypothetical protein WICPIJ_007789 [Wickerhamomyces pijperi]
MDGLWSHESFDTDLTQFSPMTRQLDTTEWDLDVGIVVGVDPNHTRFQILSHQSGSGDILDTDGDNWTKDLLLDNLEVWLHVSKDGWLNEVTLLQVWSAWNITPKNDSGTFLLTGLEVAQDLLVLDLGDLWTNNNTVFEWHTLWVFLLNVFFQSSEELLVNGVLDVDSGGTGTDLTHVGENTDSRPGNSFFEVTVIENQHWGLTTSFNGTWFQVDSGIGLDLSGCEGGPGEGDLVDTQVLNQGVTSNHTGTRQDLDDTWWETSFFTKLDKLNGVIKPQTPIGSMMVYANFLEVVGMVLPWILSVQPARYLITSKVSSTSNLALLSYGLPASLASMAANKSKINIFRTSSMDLGDHFIRSWVDRTDKFTRFCGNEFVVYE